jgi:hypothetical protein
MGNKQIQKGGNNSQQFQAETVINFGIDEKRVREIFAEMFDLERKNLTIEAMELANNRVQQFEDRLIPKIMAIDGLNAFADPGFQLLLRKAQIAAAVTERENDYEILSELLIHRHQKGGSRNTRAGITRAVEIVDQISDDALLGLTVMYAIIYFSLHTGDVLQGLDVLNDMFKKLIYAKLPEGNAWLDHLDVLDAARITTFARLGRIQEYLSENLEGYIACGIKKSSENLNSAVKILNDVSIPQNILTDHILNNEYVRLNIPHLSAIDTLTFQQNVIKNDNQVNNKCPISNEQKDALHKFYTLYDRDSEIRKQNIVRFMEEWNKRKYLRVLREWWNGIDADVQITSVGKVLAHANAQRCDKNFSSSD